MKHTFSIRCIFYIAALATMLTCDYGLVNASSWEKLRRQHNQCENYLRSGKCIQAEACFDRNAKEWRKLADSGNYRYSRTNAVNVWGNAATAQRNKRLAAGCRDQQAKRRQFNQQLKYARYKNYDPDSKLTNLSIGVACVKERKQDCLNLISDLEKTGAIVKRAYSIEDDLVRMNLGTIISRTNYLGRAKVLQHVAFKYELIDDHEGFGSLPDDVNESPEIKNFHLVVCLANPLPTIAKDSDSLERLASPDGRYSIDSHGQITDHTTRLQWFVNPNVLDKKQVIAWAAKNAGGGWRLPSINELQGLYDKEAYKRQKYKINPIFELPNANVWSNENGIDSFGSNSLKNFNFYLGNIDAGGGYMTGMLVRAR